MNLSARDRKILVTFIGAGIAAIFGEHLLKPSLKRRLGV